MQGLIFALLVSQTPNRAHAITYPYSMYLAQSGYTRPSDLCDEAYKDP